MNIEEFLEKYVEGYLFCDLQSMSGVVLPPAQRYGDCRYAMLMVTLSGMELLGGLLSEAPFDLHNGHNYFDEFWIGHLSKTYPLYKPAALGGLLRQLARHGLAHTFSPKPGILVTKGKPDHHLRFPGEDQVIVDAVQLCKDFKDCYNKSVKPLLREPLTRNRMQQRLTEMISAYSKQSVACFGRIDVRPDTRIEYCPTDTSQTFSEVHVMAIWPSSELPTTGPCRPEV